MTYPATCIVQWPSGPVAACNEHARQLLYLGEFLGSNVVATTLLAPAQCVNCLNEAREPDDG